MKKYGFKIISLIMFLVAMGLLTCLAIPLIKTYKDPVQFQAMIEGFGAWGVVIMLFIQIAQIIVALIPGEVVEFVAGTLYGCLGGWLFCTIGILIGQTIIFLLVRFLGKDFVEQVAGSEKLKKFTFLQDEKKLKRLIFILFFIPGTPKDLLTYIVPLTRISLREFLILTLIARIPSVISSTYAGAVFADRKFEILVLVYLIVGALSLLGVLIYNKWEKRKTSSHKKR